MGVRIAVLAAATATALALAAGSASAGVTPSSSCPPGQSPAEAWWTGPMLANSAATLPRGHLLVEPYVYDVSAQGAHDVGTLTYVIYGVADRVGVGLIPTAGYNAVSGGPNSSGIGLGDVGLLAQFRLTAIRPCGRMPTISVAVQETLPTGRYDRLGDRPSNGFGSGAYTSTVSLYTQKYLWLPNGRILRMRLNFSQGVSSSVDLEGVSVYGTTDGFRGRTTPGSSSFVNAAWEYSLTRRWVLALDATYRHARNTRVTGTAASAGVVLNSGAGDAAALAPAVEYSWTSNVGVLVGVRVMPAVRNATATLTPAIAINIVR